MPEGVDSASIHRRTFSSQIYSLLEAKVLAGELLPGTKLSEESLAESYGVSRSPAREALADLERVGLAVRAGTRDRMITIPSATFIAQKFDLWWIIDAGRTYLASLGATPADHAEMRTCVDQMAAAVSCNDKQAYRQTCDAFHQKIRSGCGNRYVNQHSADCDLYMRWFETLYDREPEISSRMVEEHYSILAAYENCDLGALYESVRVHLYHQRERILAHFLNAPAGRNFVQFCRQPQQRHAEAGTIKGK